MARLDGVERPAGAAGIRTGRGAVSGACVAVQRLGLDRPAQGSERQPDRARDRTDHHAGALRGPRDRLEGGRGAAGAGTGISGAAGAARQWRDEGWQSKWTARPQRGSWCTGAHSWNAGQSRGSPHSLRSRFQARRPRPGGTAGRSSHTMRARSTCRF